MSEVRLTATSPTEPPARKRDADLDPSNAENISDTIEAKSTEQALNQEQDEQQPEAQNIEQAVARLNDYVQSIQRDLHFSLDDNSGRTVISVIDRKSQEVVRQIPDDVVLKLAHNLSQNEPIQLFKVEV